LLATIPGIGPIGGLSFALKVPDPKVFRSSRHFAVWIGITPRENSTAGRQPRGKISRAGDESLRQLLVLGATAGHPVGHQEGQRRAVAARITGPQAEESRRCRIGQQDGAPRLGDDDQRRTLPPATGRLSPPKYQLNGTSEI
jgi:transposase